MATQKTLSLEQHKEMVTLTKSYQQHNKSTIVGMVEFTSAAMINFLSID